MTVIMMEIVRDLLSGSLIATASTSFLPGIKSHLCIVNAKIDYRVWRLLGVYILTMVGLAMSYKILGSFGKLEVLTRVLIVALSFNTGLTLSILTYRLLFHRLCNFPGPVGAKVSRFYATALAARKIQYHLEVKNLHEKYGDFVRTGPREITIFRARAVCAIHGPQTACRKSTWYSQVSNDVRECSLNSSCDFEDHKRRRRAWDQGFSVKALKTYEPKILRLLDLLIAQLRVQAQNGTPIEITAWSMYFTFDTMGAVGFSKDFLNLDAGTETPAIRGLHDQMKTWGVLSSIPWFLRIVEAIPGLAGSYALFTQWCGDCIEKEKVPRWRDTF